MSKTKLVLALAMLLVAAVVVAGASRPSAVSVPPGEIVESPNVRVNAGAPRPSIPDAPALAPAADAVLVSDDFSSGNLNKWQSLAGAPSTWVARDGRLQQRGDERGENGNEDAVILAKDVTLSDGILEADVYPTGGSPVGLVFRGSDAGYYRVTLYGNLPNSSPKALVQKVSADKVQDLATVPVSKWAGYTLAGWQRVTVNMDGSRITVSVNGTQIANVTDGSYSNGWAGVWTVADMGAQFDNIRIQRTAGR